MKRLAFVTLAFLGLLVIAVWGRFNYISICKNCGTVQNSTDWQIPLTEITYWHSRSELETPLSKAISLNGLSVPHVHDWMFAHGSGNGAMCALGLGGHIASAAYSPQAAIFLDAVTKWQGKAKAERWLQLLLDPKRSDEALSSILLLDTPMDGFADQPHFEKWWREHQDQVASALDPVAVTSEEPTTRPAADALHL
jgi:hypothetical protein